MNEPGVLWVEALGGRIERHAIPDLTEARLWRLAQQIGSATCQGISREHPLLAARLPGGERVQVVALPATRSGVVLAIRKYVADDLSLLDLEQQGILASTTGSAVVDPHEERLAALYDAGRWRAFLQTAVRARRTILISGGTSTGKTTILSALIREIDPVERLVFLEDTPELVLRHPNAIGLVAARDALAETSVTTEDLLVASLRLRPDRIILGELRGVEAFTFLHAVSGCDRQVSTGFDVNRHRFTPMQINTLRNGRKHMRPKGGAARRGRTVLARGGTACPMDQRTCSKTTGYLYFLVAVTTGIPYQNDMHTVIETNAYIAAAKAAGMTAAEMAAVVEIVAANPEAGDIMPGCGGARKLRVAKPGKGKSGGYRVITFYASATVPVFLLTVFGKNEKANLTQAERNALAKLTKLLVASL